MKLSHQIKLGILIPLHIPSTICHAFVIYHLLKHLSTRQAIHHHIVLVFLITNFFLITIDLPMIYYFLVVDQLTENDANFCVTWNFFDKFLSNSCTFLMMWSTLERHLLIFYDRQLFNSPFKRFIFHYMPIFLAIFYAFVFYLILAYVSPTCSNVENFQYDELFCAQLCYVHATIEISLFDLLIHRIVCSVLILVFGILLLVRILYRKRARNQVIRWQRHYKMTVQVLSIATMYLIGTFPAAIGELLHIFKGHSEETEESVIQEEAFLYLFQIMSLIIPFVSLMSLPDVYKRIPGIEYFQRAILPSNPVTNSIIRHPTGMPEHIT
jgi:hypothetical protein